MKKIITINRQFSSGGREIGKKLADKLNISYFDRELIEKIAQETQFHPGYIEQFSESVASRQYPLTFGRSFNLMQTSPTDIIQMAQNKIIKDLAENQDCVIVGRCANYILKDYDVLRVFIYSSDMQKRIERCYKKVPEDKDKTEDQIQKQIINLDKKRAKYHNYYSGQEWQDMSNYNLCIDTAKIDINKAVELIISAM